MGIRIPRKVAGIKIPGRKNAVSEFLSSTSGRLLIAEAVTLAITALAMRKTSSGERAGVVVARRAAKLGNGAQKTLRREGNQLASALRAGVTAFRDKKRVVSRRASTH